MCGVVFFRSGSVRGTTNQCTSINSLSLLQIGSILCTIKAASRLWWSWRHMQLAFLGVEGMAVAVAWGFGGGGGGDMMCYHHDRIIS